MSLKLTTFNNLTELSRHWERMREYVQFDMSSYGGIQGMHRENIMRKNVLCRPKCCFLGLAPEILDIDRGKHFNNSGYFSYRLFSIDHFPYLYTYNMDNARYEENYMWMYLFGIANGISLGRVIIRVNDVVTGKITYDNVLQHLP